MIDNDYSFLTKVTAANTTTTATDAVIKPITTDTIKITNDPLPISIDLTTDVTTLFDYDYGTYTMKKPNKLNSISFEIKTEKNFEINCFKKIEVLKENKVMRFTFYDDTVIKTVCHELDTFDLEFSFYLALAKYFDSKKELTPEGLVYYAKELSYYKLYNKIVKNGIKLFYKQQKEERDLLTKEIREKERHRKYINKKKLRKQKIQNKIYEQTYQAMLDALLDAQIIKEEN